MSRRLARLAVVAVIVSMTLVGGAEAQSPRPTPAPKTDGPVQGYQGGYDPIDKSKAPAAPDGKKTDAGNAHEGQRGTSVSGAIKTIDGRTLTLDNGVVLVVPPTLRVDETVLQVGARIVARYEDQGGTHVVTTIRREPS